jgi:hypothetical protein
MSRGLGKLQHAILEYLRTQGKPCWASDIAWTLFYNQDHVRERDPMPRSFRVSVGRAMHTLQQRGLVYCMMCKAQYQRDVGNRLMCWLPEHTPRQPREIIHAKEVEHTILMVLTHAREEEIDAYLSQEYGVRIPMVEKRNRYFRKPGEVPYSWLSQQVVERIDPDYYGFRQGRALVAFHRAIKSLARQGRITAHWGRYRRYAWVQLKQQ